MDLPAATDAPLTLDELEALMAANHPKAECPVIHRFTPGLYIREIHCAAGTLGTSMEHRTEHPFVLSKGRVRIISENEGSVTYEAPYCGITKPGTRRLVYAETDIIWTTFHVTDETDVEKIVEAITVPHCNPLVPPELANVWRDSCPKLPPT